MSRVSLEATIALVRRVLPVHQAEVLVLRLVQGLSVDEVATVSAKSPGNVRVLHHRALHRLGLRIHPEEVA